MADLRLPSLLPKVVDPTWFCVDKPVNYPVPACIRVKTNWSIDWWLGQPMD